MDEDREWEQWRAWLGDAPEGRTIYDAVVNMMMRRQVWDRFAVVVKNAPERAQRDGTFVWWVRWNYERSQGIAIRTQVEVRGDVMTLGHLIDRVWRYPTVLSRERYLTLHQDQDWATREANGWFDNLAGRGGEFIDPRIPATDLAFLRDRTKKIKDWVNTFVAHSTATQVTVDPRHIVLKAKSPQASTGIPSLDEIHEAVDEVAKMFRKYVLLIRGFAMSREVIMQPWEVVFREAWIPDDDHWRRIIDDYPTTFD